MEVLIERLLDKWTGVFLYRFLEVWEQNGFHLENREQYSDFVALHGNRLAFMLALFAGGWVIDDLRKISEEILAENKDLQTYVRNLVSESKNQPTILERHSREYEKLRSFWLGFLVANSVPNLEQLVGDEIDKAWVKSQYFANHLSREYFDAFYEVVTAYPESRVLLCPENREIISFIEARFFFNGEIEKSLKFLWDHGVNLGRKYQWPDAREAVSCLPDDFHEAVIQLMNTTTDFVVKTGIRKILAIGTKGKLISMLKKSTWHDRQDRIKRSMAQKRQPSRPDVPIHDYDTRHKISLSEDQVLSSKGQYISEEKAFIQSENRMMLNEMADLDLLTSRERQVLVLKIAGAEAGEIPTNKKVGEKLGISEVRVKQLFDSTCQKLRGFYSSLDS